MDPSRVPMQVPARVTIELRCIRAIAEECRRDSEERFSKRRASACSVEDWGRRVQGYSGVWLEVWFKGSGVFWPPCRRMLGIERTRI